MGDTLASRLVLARLRAGLSRGQTETLITGMIGGSCGLARFESGEWAPTRDELATLADYYGVSVDWLLHGATPERIAWAEAQVPATVPADDRAKIVDLLVSLRSGDTDNA